MDIEMDLCRITWLQDALVTSYINDVLRACLSVAGLATWSWRSSRADRSAVSSELTRSPMLYRFSIAVKNAVAPPALSKDRMGERYPPCFSHPDLLVWNFKCRMAASTVAARGREAIGSLVSTSHPQ